MSGIKQFIQLAIVATLGDSTVGGSAVGSSTTGDCTVGDSTVGNSTVSEEASDCRREGGNISFLRESALGIMIMHMEVELPPIGAVG